MSWQKPWNLQSHLRPCFNCGVQYKRDSLGCPNCGAPKGLQQGKGDRFIKRNQERTPSKEMRSPTFQIPEDSLRDRVVDIFQMAFDIIKNSLRESWLGQEILQRTNFATRPTETGPIRPVMLGDLFRQYLNKVGSESGNLTDVSAKVPELDYLSAFFYEDLVRTASQADFASWCASFEKADHRIFGFVKPYTEEIYCRGKAIFIGMELKSSGVWRYQKWSTCLLAQLNPEEREFITPFTRQIHQRTNEILLESTGSRMGVQVTTQQRRVVLAGLALILLMLLVPPWKSSGGSRRGYGVIFAPPRGASSIDLSRLFVQSLFVAILTGGIVFVLQSREK